jgi:pyrrolysine biosynthesis protein PylC
MVLAAVVGGSLQGVEAAYLAHKAGWEVLLIDKRPQTPASGLCDVFVQLDVTAADRLEAVIKEHDADLVIPALENRAALDGLQRWARCGSAPLLFDAHAYAVSSSKLESNRLFQRIGAPMPRSWPGCGFPLIAKPDGESGSKGVQIINNEKELRRRFPGSTPPDGWILQEYLEGPSFSLEVVGFPGHYAALQTTDLEMDEGYDCKRVLAPSRLAPGHVKQFEALALNIAGALQLRGLMDVEVILHDHRLKLLEIDARLPSQTPAAVYRSSGINMLELLAHVFSSTTPPGKNGKSNTPPQGVIYEHIKVSPGTLEVCGEHIMARAGPLHLEEDFFGAREAITDYVPGADRWAAALVNVGGDLQEAFEARARVIDNIRSHCHLPDYKDPGPLINTQNGVGDPNRLHGSANAARWRHRVKNLFFRKLSGSINKKGVNFHDTP